MRLLGQAIHARRDELLSLLTIVLLALLISATVMYSAEHEAQPKTFGSIPQALWWSVATLTTVGYGDIYPVTVLGRICASFIMLLGIGLVALPTGLLGSAMYELLTLKSCPHCGADLRPHEAHHGRPPYDGHAQGHRNLGSRRREDHLFAKTPRPVHAEGRPVSCQGAHRDDDGLPFAPSRPRSSSAGWHRSSACLGGTRRAT